MSLNMIADALDADIERWYEKQRSDGLVTSNVMTVGLIMCEHMATHFPLRESEFMAPSQVRLLSGSRIKEILARHDETRKFTSEGGRTSRGSQGLAQSFAEVVNRSSVACEFRDLGAEGKATVVGLLQGAMVSRIRVDFFDRQRLELEVDVGKHTRSAVETLLGRAGEKGGNAAGAVAQHLVGAKLAIRHPGLGIENQSYTTADQPTGRAGDFMVNDTVVHVTLSPTEALLTKCRGNIEQRYRPMVVTPSDKMDAARVMAEHLGIAERVTIRGIEEFIAGNVDEMAEYSTGMIPRQLRQLLEEYNKRVAEVESTPSLLVQIPENLA